jgi:hypothetical protein
MHESYLQARTYGSWDLSCMGLAASALRFDIELGTQDKAVDFDL